MADVDLALSLLDGAYERLRPDERRVYGRALGDLPPADVEEAILTLIATRRRRPSIAEIRSTVTERRLDLPDAAATWLAIVELARTLPAYERCDACGGSGETLGPVIVGCSSCRGEGRVEVAKTALRSRLPSPALSALAYVGGSAAVAAHDRPDILRAQFVREYDRLRSLEIDRANLASAGLAPPTLTRGSS